MADNKLSWSELRRVLAQRAGVSEQEANAFLNALNEQLVDALKTDKQVKINGLGTFKLQAVAPRKSVNVTTGEEIIIEGYNKVSFAPEAGVKELVEKTQPSVVSIQPSEVDPLKKLGEQAEEIVDILGDLGQSPKEEKEAPEEQATPVVEEPKTEVEEQPAPVVEEPKTEVEELPTPVVEEPKTEVEEQPAPVVEEPKVVIAQPEVVIEQPKIVVESTPFVFTAPGVEEPKKEGKKKDGERHVGRTILIILLILLLLAGLVGYFFFRDQVCGWYQQAKDYIPVIKEYFMPAQTDTIPTVVNDTTDEAVIPVDTLSAEELQTREQIISEYMSISGETQNNKASDGAVYEEMITIEPMHQDSRLAWMAKRFYGDKAYWPYLYDANKDHIDNPSDIEVGTPIRVPKLTEAQRDTTSALYKRLKEEAYKAVK